MLRGGRCGESTGLSAGCGARATCVSTTGTKRARVRGGRPASSRETKSTFADLRRHFGVAVPYWAAVLPSRAGADLVGSRGPARLWPVLTVLVGVALLTVMIRSVGLEEVVRGVSRLGPWFA